MSGLFSTFNIAVKGMNAQQTAINTTGHNIANANTEGFSRQRVDLETETPQYFPGIGSVGNGVKVESIVRIADDFTDMQIRTESGNLSMHESSLDILEQLEVVFNEPSDIGINSAMGEMFDAWQELAKNPESLSAKSIVAEKSKTFTDSLNQMARNIESIKGHAVDEATKCVLNLNSVSQRLTSLNEQIKNISIKGHSPNDLLDERDRLLKEMASLANVDIAFDKLGSAEVSLNGTSLTGTENEYVLSTVYGFKENSDGTFDVQFAYGGDPSDMRLLSGLSESQINGLSVGSTVFALKSGPSAFGDIILAPIQSGSIAGIQASLAQIDDSMEDLNGFAKGMAEMVNTIHGENGPEFFSFESGVAAAAGISVNQSIMDDERLVETGFSAASPEGDGSRALAIARLRNAKISFDGSFAFSYDPNTMTITNEIGGTDPVERYANMIAKLGIATERASDLVSNQEALLAQLENRREAISGVSIDEEVTNLIKHQKSYEANAKLIATLTEMLDTLINRTGV